MLMRLEKKHEAELARRKGLTGRTLLASLWLFASFIVSYLLSSWLFQSETIGLDTFYMDLGIPETVDEIFIRLALAVLIFVFVQFLVLIGYAAFSPKARMRPGTPSAVTSNPDPYDTKITYD